MPRHEQAHRLQTPSLVGWPKQLAISAGFGGLLMLVGAISFPLPWTPVPFSMMPFGLLIVGAYQRPMWAALSVVLYLAAAGLGAPVFADGESGWHHFVGATAGYLFGFVAVSAFVSWYMQERRALLPMRWVAIIGSIIGLLVVAGIVAIIDYQSSGGLQAYGTEGFGIGRSVLWALLFLLTAATTMTVWALKRARGEGLQALNAFLVMLAAIGILHAMGVTGLVLIAELPVVTAMIVGSVVFLPFDIVKAGLAVGLSLPFLPAPRADPHNGDSHE